MAFLKIDVKIRKDLNFFLINQRLSMIHLILTFWLLKVMTWVACLSFIHEYRICFIQCVHNKYEYYILHITYSCVLCAKSVLQDIIHYTARKCDAVGFVRSKCNVIKINSNDLNYHAFEDKFILRKEILKLAQCTNHFL